MSFITCDLETYYDKVYSLKKMTTEEYINDDRFEIIGVGVKIDDGPSQWYSGPEPQVFLRQFDCDNSAWLFHNAMFDAAILYWKFGIRPAMIYDTMCMSRLTDGTMASASLAAMSERHGTGVKGNDLLASIGKRRKDFTPEGLAAFGCYCRNDVELTYKLFNKLSVGFPETEFELIDITTRMFTQPVLEVDDYSLVQKLESIKNTKTVLLSGLTAKLGVETEEAVRAILASNKRFAQILEELGIFVPMKISPATDKPTFALAKTDQGFIELQDHPDPFIQQLCAVRLGVKSTMEESRIVKFIEVGARNHGKLPVPLRYGAAHTMRWGGMDGINIQNLPSRDQSKRTLKTSLQAPFGHRLLNGDSSQIEARKLVWWAGQDDVTELFRKGVDVYCSDASEAYGRLITKFDITERFVGKTLRLGMGYGTGAVKLQDTLRKAGVEIPIDRANEFVSVWRRANPKIVDLWSQAGAALQDLMSWPQGKPWYWLGEHEVALVTPIGIKLPNGMFLRYRNLHLNEQSELVHDARYGETRIWGGVVCENIVQALARIVIGEQMIQVASRYKIALTVHDSILAVAPENEVDEAKRFMLDIMSRAPIWATGCPITAEIKCGQNYGEC